MALTLEWRRRLEIWRSVMPKLFYTPLQSVQLETYSTKVKLGPERGARGAFKKIQPGRKWGLPWEYSWFRGRVRLPREAAGRRIVFRGEMGGDALVFVNGRAAGTFDRQHREVTLALKGRPGQAFSFLAEVYSGQGPYLVGDGPVPDGTDYIPRRLGPQCTLGTPSVGIWEEELYQAYMDFETLFQLRDQLHADDLRVSEIDEGLRGFTLALDLELPLPALRQAALKGRRLLKPLMDAKNGSSAPVMHCFGHSHIDVAWLWPLAETERKCGRTFSTQMALMEQYPEFRFLQSQPHLYRMASRDYPEIYRRIKEKAKKGQWIPEGGMWVEADTNISGGEALIRQFLHGKKFFKDEFGIESELMWLPDVFGYSGAMPQIMAGCGIKYFSTAKIFWNYYGGDTFPYNSFWWEGIDGSKVFAHMHNDYNSHTEPRQMVQRWRERVQKDQLKGRLMPFGWGDGGGGITRDHLEYLRRMRDLEGAPKNIQAPPNGYLRKEAARRKDWPTYVGELYFQAHRGTYTTQGHTKKGNRKGELILREAEIWASAALGLRPGKYAYPASAMDEAWKGLLLNQFHDILPGSSIPRVYVDAEAGYARVQAAARATIASGCGALARRDASSLTVFNSLNWRRDALVELPAGFKGASDESGQALPVQKHAGKSYVLAQGLPSCGWATLRKSPAQAKAASSTGLKVDSRHLENRYLRATFNAKGEVESLYDKTAERELLSGPANSFRMYKDIPSVHDAWDVDSHYKQAPVALDGPSKLEVQGRGPLFVSLKLTRRVSRSLLTQEIRLGLDSMRLDFITHVDWKEKHRLLKVNFPVAVQAEQALHEIQFGHLARPTHTSRQYDADRFEVSAHKWTALCESRRGAAVLNDCKYGVNVEGSSINLSLLRAPQAPDPTADIREHDFSYSLYCWEGDSGLAGLVREAYEFNVEATLLPGAAGSASLLSLDAPGIVMEALKPAEDGSGDLILRLYEATRSATRAALSFGLPVKEVHSAEMLEKRLAKLPLRQGVVELEFRPFEIKTLRLTCRR